jgi:acyl-CoA thioesterase FadM
VVRLAERVVVDGVVPWADTDASGRFHFTAPLRWVEDVEHRAYRTAGLDPGRFPRRAVASTYVRPLGAGDPYTVDLVVERVGTTSIGYRWRVLSDGAVCVEGSHTVVHVGDDGRPAPLPDDLRAALTGG